jgi:hypothetical protein
MNLANPAAGKNPLTILANGNIGFGTVTPFSRFHMMDSGNSGLRVENGATGGTVASFGGRGDFSIDSSTSGAGARLLVKENGNVGIGTPAAADKLDVNGITRVRSLGSAGNTPLCWNNSSQISNCSSSLRYKTDLHPFIGGMNVVNRLQPITFRWKADQSLDLGFGAEDVAKVEPLLVTHNDKGQIEGVKYDRLSAVFINAFKEQQSQIKELEAEAKARQAEVNRQKNQIASLRMVNDALDSRLRLIEKTLKRNRAARRRG